MDDRALLLAIGQGDDRALRELFERHAPWMTVRLRRSLPPAAVEDVLQETFIAAWKGAKGFRGDGDVGAWLWGIGRRQVAMWLRKNCRTEAELDGRIVMTIDPVSEALDRSVVQEALNRLGPDGSEQRELARMVWEDDLPIQEVAARLRVPQGTVKSRLHRARKLLWAALGQGGES